MQFSKDLDASCASFKKRFDQLKDQDIASPKFSAQKPFGVMQSSIKASAKGGAINDGDMLFQVSPMVTQLGTFHPLSQTQSDIACQPLLLPKRDPQGAFKQLRRDEQESSLATQRIIDSSHSKASANFGNATNSLKPGSSGTGAHEEPYSSTFDSVHARVQANQGPLARNEPHSTNSVISSATLGITSLQNKTQPNQIGAEQAIPSKYGSTEESRDRLTEQSEDKENQQNNKLEKNDGSKQVQVSSKESDQSMKYNSENKLNGTARSKINQSLKTQFNCNNKIAKNMQQDKRLKQDDVDIDIVNPNKIEQQEQLQIAFNGIYSSQQLSKMQEQVNQVQSSQQLGGVQQKTPSDGTQLASVSVNKVGMSSVDSQLNRNIEKDRDITAKQAQISKMRILIDRSIVGAPDLQTENCNAAQVQNKETPAGDDQFSMEYSAYLQQLKNNPKPQPASPLLNGQRKQLSLIQEHSLLGERGVHPLMGLIDKYVSGKQKPKRGDDSYSSSSCPDSDPDDQAEDEESDKAAYIQAALGIDGEPFALTEFMTEFTKEVQSFNAAYLESKKQFLRDMKTFQQCDDLRREDEIIERSIREDEFYPVTLDKKESAPQPIPTASFIPPLAPSMAAAAVAAMSATDGGLSAGLRQSSLQLPLTTKQQRSMTVQNYIQHMEDFYSGLQLQSNMLQAYYPRRVQKLMAKRKNCNSDRIANGLASLVQSQGVQPAKPIVKPLPRKKFENKLKKMKLLSRAQAGFIQLALQKIDRRSKPIKKQSKVLDDALRRKRIQLEKDGWDILSLLKKQKREGDDDELELSEEDACSIVREERTKRAYRKRIYLAALVSREDQEVLKARGPQILSSDSEEEEPETPLLPLKIKKSEIVMPSSLKKIQPPAEYLEHSSVSGAMRGLHNYFEGEGSSLLPQKQNVGQNNTIVQPLDKSKGQRKRSVRPQQKATKIEDSLRQQQKEPSPGIPAFAVSQIQNEISVLAGKQMGHNAQKISDDAKQNGDFTTIKNVQPKSAGKPTVREAADQRVSDCLRKIDLGLPTGTRANTTGKKRTASKKMKKAGQKSKTSSEPKLDTINEQGVQDIPEHVSQVPTPQISQQQQIQQQHHHHTYYYHIHNHLHNCQIFQQHEHHHYHNAQQTAAANMQQSQSWKKGNDSIVVPTPPRVISPTASGPQQSSTIQQAAAPSSGAVSGSPRRVYSPRPKLNYYSGIGTRADAGIGAISPNNQASLKKEPLLLNRQRRDQAGLPEESSQLEGDEVSSCAPGQRQSLTTYPLPQHQVHGYELGHQVPFDAPQPNAQMNMENEAPFMFLQQVTSTGVPLQNQMSEMPLSSHTNNAAFFMNGPNPMQGAGLCFPYRGLPQQMSVMPGPNMHPHSSQSGSSSSGPGNSSSSGPSNSSSSGSGSGQSGSGIAGRSHSQNTSKQVNQYQQQLNIIPQRSVPLPVQNWHQSNTIAPIQQHQQMQINQQVHHPGQNEIAQPLPLAGFKRQMRDRRLDLESAGIGPVNHLHTVFAKRQKLEPVSASTPSFHNMIVGPGLASLKGSIYQHQQSEHSGNIFHPVEQVTKAIPSECSAAVRNSQQQFTNQK